MFRGTPCTSCTQILIGEEKQSNFKPTCSKFVYWIVEDGFYYFIISNSGVQDCNELYYLRLQKLLQP